MAKKTWTLIDAEHNLDVGDWSIGPLLFFPYYAADIGDSGTFAGMRNTEVLAYLKALGITSVELMPIQAWIDERHLADRGLRNYWGYNTIAFFAPMPRLAAGAAREELLVRVDGNEDPFPAEWQEWVHPSCDMEPE